MTVTLGEALPAGIAKVAEHVGKMEAQAKEFDALSPGLGDGTRFVIEAIRAQLNAAVAAQQSGDVVEMIAAYQQLKPAIELATADEELVG